MVGIIAEGRRVQITDGNKVMDYSFYSPIMNINGSIDHDKDGSGKTAELRQWKFENGTLINAYHIQRSGRDENTQGKLYEQILVNYNDKDLSIPAGFHLPIMDLDSKDGHRTTFQIEKGKVTKGTRDDGLPASKEAVKNAQQSLKAILKEGLAEIKTAQQYPEMKDKDDRRQATDAAKADLAGKSAEAELADLSAGAAHAGHSAAKTKQKAAAGKQ